ncbi:MAG: hypothetical protein ACTSRK_13920, partial [Promethearchaeota archaeon]
MSFFILFSSTTRSRVRNRWRFLGGRWLSHNQQHFFHSQIIDRVRFMASFQGFTVIRLNARW